jgi:hypothetical protein
MLPKRINDDLDVCVCRKCGLIKFFFRHGRIPKYLVSFQDSSVALSEMPKCNPTL